MAGSFFLEVSGDARQRGLAHGEELRPQVVACVDFYRRILGLGERELEERAATFESLIAAYAPLQADEIRGVAAGAGLPESYLFAINARSELVPIEAGECTVLCVPEFGLLGQTWDWCRELEDLVTVLKVTLQDGHQLLTVTEPGILGKIGLSSAGVGVCLNFLAAPRLEDGVPIHTLLREALEAPSMARAIQRLREAGTGRGGNIVLGAERDDATSFEFAGDQVCETTVKTDFCHTNHCLFSPVPAGEMEANSKARYTRANQLMAALEPLDLGSLRTILSDQGDSESPICAPYQTVFGLTLGTLCTVIMDIAQRQLHLRKGAIPGGEFAVYDL